MPPLVFADEPGFYLLPGRVWTSGPRDQTPVLFEQQTLTHLSLMDTDAFLKCLGRQAGALSDGAESPAVEFLPSYAPDITPVKRLWRHPKLEEMKNLT